MPHLLPWVTETALGPSACFGNRVFQALPPALWHQIETSLATDRELRHHSSRLGALAHLVGRLAERTDSGWLAKLAEATVLHDIGKLRLDAAILGKTGLLGAEMLAAFGGEGFGVATLVARYHHETYDGSGYPEGLTGDAVPEEARVVALCDVYDALRTPRAYKSGFDHSRTMTIMTKGDGRTKPEHFDPHLLRLFMQLSAEVEALYEAT